MHSVGDTWRFDQPIPHPSGEDGAEPEPRQPGWARKARAVVVEESEGFDPAAIVARLLGVALPPGVGNRTRTAILRRAGFSIGHASIVFGTLRVTGGGRASRRLTVGRDCFINQGCCFDATVSIDIGDRVAIGQEVLMTTSSHESDNPDQRGGSLVHAPIRIGSGAWVASRAVVLGGVTIGEGAIVGAGAVVTRSVAAHTMVGGVPARHIRDLPR